MGGFGFGGDQYETPCLHFSGGEKSMAYIGLPHLGSPSNLLLLR